MSAHTVFWTTPSPLWKHGGSAEELKTLSKPALLRFATDDFMNEYMTMLASDPSLLSTVKAQRETWDRPQPPSGAALLSLEREGMAEPAKHLGFLKRAKARKNGKAADPKPAGNPSTAVIKLFQPVHQRYYLVGACLLCKVVGLGDHTLNTEMRETVGFVVRRLVNPDAKDESHPASLDAFDEYAYVRGPRGAGWIKTDTAKKLMPGEERLPLFPVYFKEENGMTRRLFSGLVPVSRKDEYCAAGTVFDKEGERTAAATTKKTGRLRLFQMKVAGPWQRLVEQAAVINATAVFDAQDERQIADAFEDPPETGTKNTKAVEQHRSQVLELSRLVLFDYADFLKNQLPDTWDDCIAASTRAPSPGAEAALVSALSMLKPSATVVADFTIGGSAPSLLEAVKKISGETDTATTFPLAYLDKNVFTVGNDAIAAGAPATESDAAVPEDGIDGQHPSNDGIDTFQTLLAIIDTLTTLTIRAMPETPATGFDFPPPLAAQPPADLREGYFVLRCVFERPRCGTILQPPVVSDPTDPFMMAGFFDPEAPARPIRIGLPLDTTPAGLRKFAKNTAFMISDVLCGQIQSIKKMTFGDLVRSVLPWPFHKDLSARVGAIKDCKTKKEIPAGMMCSLSIPIVTICALILLIMIVTILDYIFKWLPYFIVCFPLPKFKGKKPV